MLYLLNCPSTEKNILSTHMAKHRTTSIQTDSDLKIIIFNNNIRRRRRGRKELYCDFCYISCRGYYYWTSLKFLIILFFSPNHVSYIWFCPKFIYSLFIYLFIDKRTSFIKVSLYLLNLLKGRHYLVEIKLDMNEQIWGSKSSLNCRKYR